MKKAFFVTLLSTIGFSLAANKLVEFPLKRRKAELPLKHAQINKRLLSMAQINSESPSTQLVKEVNQNVYFETFLLFGSQ